MRICTKKPTAVLETHSRTFYNLVRSSEINVSIALIDILSCINASKIAVEFSVYFSA